jgi:hypothetical protein
LGNSQSIKQENCAELSRDDAILLHLKHFHHDQMINHIDAMRKSIQQILLTSLTNAN